jgi:autotransporter-associated beta strand protein
LYGSGEFVKRGAGTLSIVAAQTVSNLVSIDAGTLLLSGRAGLRITLPRYSHSRCSKNPAARSATSGTMPAVEAWARCAAPKASLM